MSHARIDRRDADDTPATVETPSRPGWSKAIKCVVSAWLVFHLFALFVAPWSVPPSSLLSVQCWRICRPYLEALNLNHGYHFFAPEPGPSHLVRYEVELADGTKVNGIIPDLATHRPRLVYHRHFMLTEYLNRLALEADQFEDPKSLNAVAQSFADHLRLKHKGESVTLYLRRHYIPSPQQVVE
ncbi:MAG: hypothetical protein O2955_16095, partial [Planctomycetota bacterium]|nr:hypothetical protein [Planctomycetota bacterium]